MTASLLFASVPPEPLAAFGGPEAVTAAVDDALTRPGGWPGAPERLPELRPGAR